MENVTVNYVDYTSHNSRIDSASFELIKDINLKLKFKNDAVMITMADTISDNTELEGLLDIEKINVLIKLLSQARNQIQEIKRKD